jgi:hypothetical protein
MTTPAYRAPSRASRPWAARRIVRVDVEPSRSTFPSMNPTKSVHSQTSSRPWEAPPAGIFVADDRGPIREQAFTSFDEAEDFAEIYSLIGGTVRIWKDGAIVWEQKKAKA